MSSIAIRPAPPAAQLIAQVTTAQIFALLSNPLAPVTVGVPGKRRVEGKHFNVRAEGYVTTPGASTTMKPTLLGALAIPGTNPLAIGSWTTIAAGTAVACPNNGSCPWWLSAELITDSISGLLQGTEGQMVNNTLGASAAITGVLTGLNGTNQKVGSIVPADPIAYLAVALTFSAAGANIGNLNNFEIAF